MLKSLRKLEISRPAAVEKIVEIFLLFNRECSKQIFNIRVFNFQHENVEAPCVFRLPVISRIVAAIPEPELLTSSSILRMEESTVA